MNIEELNTTLCATTRCVRGRIGMIPIVVLLVISNYPKVQQFQLIAVACYTYCNILCVCFYLIFTIQKPYMLREYPKISGDNIPKQNTYCDLVNSLWFFDPPSDHGSFGLVCGRP